MEGQMQQMQDMMSGGGIDPMMLLLMLLSGGGAGGAQQQQAAPAMPRQFVEGGPLAMGRAAGEPAPAMQGAPEGGGIPPEMLEALMAGGV